MAEKEKTFPIDKSIAVGWEKMKKNFWFFVVILLISGVISGFFSEIERALTKDGVANIFVSIVSFFVSLLIGIGMIKISLNFIDDKKNDYSELFKNYHKVWNIFLADLLLGLIVIAGLIFLIIPGIYLGTRYSFVRYLIIDKDMGVIEAFEKSWGLTKGVFFGTMLFNIALVIIVILGLLALFLGIFAAVPITMVASAFAYRSLEKQTFKAE